MSEHISEADKAFDYATYKQPADKIRQNLSKIFNNPESSAKRWVWELIQNAKDIPNKFGKVSVEIELISEDELKFRHNGNPFLINNIIGLIRQVSSKDSLNNDEETTGKFGTGFICTHILSEIIDIEGVLNYEGYRKFDLCLDRSGRSSEELIPRIINVENNFRAPEKYFPEVSGYENKRTEDEFDTSFTYHLSSEEKQNAAKLGLNDLVNTLPITLVTQSKKIKQVRVIDRVNKTDVVYKCESKLFDDNVKFSTVSINEIIKYYLTYETTEVAITTEVQIENDGYTLIKRNSKQPVLYRDFPLIGSEKFYFPYTLNGFRLCPTEKRDSIPLNGEDNYEATDNRDIIKQAVTAAIDFNKWLIAHNVKNRYLLASSRRPQAEVEYDERIALPWIKALQSGWRKQLLDQQLAETKEGVYPLKDISVPSFAGYGESNAKDTNESFFALLDGFYLGRGYLPLSEHLHGWLDVIRPEYATWEADLKYEKDDFLIDLAKAKSINSLCATLNKNRTQVVDWLNSVYGFLINQNCLSDFDKHAIIPNMEGDFKKLNELNSDATGLIPYELMGLYNHVMPNTIQSRMIDQEIDGSVFGNTLQVFVLNTIIDWFNTTIKSNDTFSANGIRYYSKEWLAYKLIEFYPKDLDNEEYLSYRQLLYDFSAVDSNQDEYRSIAVSNTDLWREADLYWFNHNYTKIEQKESIDRISKEYFNSMKDEGDTLNWINNYLKFYRDNSKGDFIKDKKIFPTQRLKLKSLNELRYDSGVSEEFKSLAEYAVKIDFSQEKYRHILLHQSITGYEQHNPLTVKEVYEFVKSVFDQSNAQVREVLAKNAIAIIRNNDEEESSEKTLYGFAKTIYGDSIPEMGYVAQVTGFSWGFAQEFYLRKICSDIAESVNLEGFKSLSSDFKDKTDSELIEWIDSLIEFLHSYKNKRYWPIITDSEKGFGIWLNQNNDFCRFQDVRKDDNVPDELKVLAATNKHVAYDFRAKLFSLDSAYVSYLETSSIDLTEVGEFIDEKVKSYDGNKQDKDFAALIFTIGKLCSSIPKLSDIMKYYSDKKNALIVGSLGDGETLEMVGSLIQHGDEKLRVFKEILDGNTIEDLEIFRTVIQGCPADKIDIVKEYLVKIANGVITNIGGDTPTGGDDKVIPVFDVVPETFEIEVVDFQGNIQYVRTDQVQYAGLSLEEIEQYVSEAKSAVVKRFRELNEKHNLGLQFDKEKIAKHSYSQLYGISDKNGNEIPLVAHSYKGPQFRYFDLNWYDWQLLSCPDSMLWVLTVSGLQCIPLYALPIRNFNFSLDSSLSNESRAALLTLAQVGKQYNQVSFDFGNNMPRDFINPMAFDYVPKELKDCVVKIKQVCDTNLPLISDVYNSARDIPIVNSLSGYSRALKEIEETGTQRDIFESEPNNTQPPVIGTSFFE